MRYFSHTSATLPIELILSFSWAREDCTLEQHALRAQPRSCWVLWPLATRALRHMFYFKHMSSPGEIQRESHSTARLCLGNGKLFQKWAKLFKINTIISLTQVNLGRQDVLQHINRVKETSQAHSWLRYAPKLDKHKKIVLQKTLWAFKVQQCHSLTPKPERKAETETWRISSIIVQLAGFRAMKDVCTLHKIIQVDTTF